MTPEKIRECKRRYYLKYRARILEECHVKYARDSVANKARYWNNRDAILLKLKLERAANKEKARERDRNYYAHTRLRKLERNKLQRIENDKMRIRDRIKYANNREAFAAKKREENKTPEGRMRVSIYNTIKRIVGKGGSKEHKCVEYLGCTIAQARAFVEAQFLDGMTWGNHGVYGWHLDHKKPLASFNLCDPKQMIEAAHYMNLQPLWAYDNLSKGAKIIA